MASSFHKRPARRFQIRWRQRWSEWRRTVSAYRLRLIYDAVNLVPNVADNPGDAVIDVCGKVPTSQLGKRSQISFRDIWKTNVMKLPHEKKKHIWKWNGLQLAPSCPLRGGNFPLGSQLHNRAMKVRMVSECWTGSRTCTDPVILKVKKRAHAAQNIHFNENCDFIYVAFFSFLLPAVPPQLEFVQVVSFWPPETLFEWLHRRSVVETNTT